MASVRVRTSKFWKFLRVTAYNCGTSIQMMNQHYRNTIDDEKSIASWALTPSKLLAQKPEIDLPSRGHWLRERRDQTV